jgi:hypothetical protein
MATARSHYKEEFRRGRGGIRTATGPVSGAHP